MIKKGLIPILLISCVFLGADDIDDIVNKIKKDRVSNINKKELLSVKSPLVKMVKIDKNSTKDSNKTGSAIVLKKESFSLNAIMNNSALINGKWYKKGEKIYSYVIEDIMDDSVYLKDRNKTKIIFFKPINNKIKIIGR